MSSKPKVFSLLSKLEIRYPPLWAQRVHAFSRKSGLQYWYAVCTINHHTKRAQHVLCLR